MNFALLWIDALLILLLWDAALVACAARVKFKWFRFLLSVFILGAPLFILGTFVLGVFEEQVSTKIRPDWFGYSLSLLVAYLVGASMILYRARRHEPGAPPAAATWRRGPLLFGWLTTVIIGYMVLCNMDFAIRARCAILSVKIHDIYLAASPAIVSDAQNAALLYNQAFSRLRTHPPVNINNGPIGNSDTFDPNEPATLTFLHQQGKTISLLRQAAALPACRFDQDLGDPNINAILGDLNEERGATNVLRLDALEELARGHTSIAILDVAAVLRMSRQFGQRPMLLSALVGCAIDGVGNETLEDSLGSVKNRDELAALHLGKLSSIGRMFRQALRGEETFGLICYGNMPDQMGFAKGATARATTFPPSLASQGGAFFRVFFLNLDAYLQLMKNAQDLAIQPYYKSLGRLPEALGYAHSSDVFTSLLGPSLVRSFDTLPRAEAGDACARAAVAMTRFRLDHGKFPPRLDELVPAYLNAIPIDPFDGHPLRLAIRNNQWIIYSIGPDGVDNGGIEMAKGNGDLIFTLKASAVAATTQH